MLTPAQPVSSNIFFAASGVMMSPLPITGMFLTASTTLRMPARLTIPPKPCSRVRPWMLARGPTGHFSSLDGRKRRELQPSRCFAASRREMRAEDAYGVATGGAAGEGTFTGKRW